MTREVLALREKLPELSNPEMLFPEMLFLTKRLCMKDWVVLPKNFCSFKLLKGGELDIMSVDTFDSVFHCDDWVVYIDYADTIRAAKGL